MNAKLHTHFYAVLEQEFEEQIFALVKTYLLLLKVFETILNAEQT